MEDRQNKGILGYLLKRKHGRERPILLHRNLLLPCMALPAYKPGAGCSKFMTSLVNVSLSFQT